MWGGFLANKIALKARLKYIKTVDFYFLKMALVLIESFQKGARGKKKPNGHFLAPTLKNPVSAPVCLTGHPVDNYILIL